MRFCLRTARTEWGQIAEKSVAMRVIRVALITLALTFSMASSSSAAAGDQECLACHGQAGMKSDAGKSISIDPAKHAASAHGVLGCKDCHTAIKEFPHPAKIAKVQCSTCHADEAKSFPASSHSILGESACASCHGNVHELSTTEKLIPGKCMECHAEEAKELESSIHGQAAKNGDPDAPKCVSCHGPIHAVKGSSEADSTIARKNMAETCAKCHSDAGFLSRHKIPVAHPVDSYRAERACARGRTGQGSGHVFQLPRQSRHLSSHRCAIQGQSLESAGDLRAMP